MNQDKHIVAIGEGSLVKMPNNERDEIAVLYIDENNCYHRILLNSLELKKIAGEVIQIFAAKKMDVLVSSKKIKLLEEEDYNGKKDSSNI